MAIKKRFVFPKNIWELVAEINRRVTDAKQKNRSGRITPKANFEKIFFDKACYYIDKATDCLDWSETNPKTGVGIIQKPHRFDPRFSEDKVQISAPRWVWELVNQQEMPEGFVTRHSCNNPRCIQPVHLYAGTDYENARDKTLTNEGMILSPHLVD